MLIVFKVDRSVQISLQMLLVRDPNVEGGVKVMFRIGAMMAKIYGGAEVGPGIMHLNFNSKNSHISGINNSRFSNEQFTH